jgi:hypothetical protein
VNTYRIVSLRRRTDQDKLGGPLVEVVHGRYEARSARVALEAFAQGKIAEGCEAFARATIQGRKCLSVFGVGAFTAECES